MRIIDLRNKCWWIAIAVVCWFFSSSGFAEVDINFSFQTDQWERNGIYELSVIMTNDGSEPINIAGVQADFSYESQDFKEEPALVHDYITEFDFTLNKVDTTTEEGVVYYSKGIKVTSSPNHFSIGGNSSKTLVTFQFRVENNEDLGVSNFNFQVTVDVIERLDDGGTIRVFGSANDNSITIIEDQIPPNTYALPSGGTIKYGDSTLVTLDEVETPAYDDLFKVYYEVGGSPVGDPGIGSSWVSKGETVPLPENDADNPGKILAQLKFFGVDHWNNQETPFHTEDYIVDIIRPALSNLSRDPERVKSGEQVTVNFTVNEILSMAPVVTVNFHEFMAGGSHPSYSYTYNVQTGDAEGSRPIKIVVRDEVGNQTINTGLSVKIDMTPPTYQPVSFLPLGADTDNVLTIKFNASEELDTDRTVVSIAGYTATFDNRSGLQYTYKYTVKGEGHEYTSFISVHGYDLVGNDSYNVDDWGTIIVHAKDQYGNPGTATATVGVEWKRQTY